jgi:multiple sugar transport system substrate-binding protein
MEAATVDGTPYAAPLYVDGTHLFYRADLLEKYGFEPPQTWEELIEQSKTIMEGEGPRMYGFVSMWAPIEGLFMNYLSFLGGAGGTFYDDAGELAIESAESVKALSTMVDILHEHQIAPDSILNMRPDDARLLFQQGRSAFLMVQDFAHGPLTAEDSPVRDAVAFKRNPVFEGNPEAHSTALGGWLLAINPFSEHKAAAGQLIAAMTSPELQTWAAVNEARAPGNQAVYDSEELAAMEGPLNGFVSNYAYGVVRPSAEAGQNYPRISEIMQAEITEALHRQKAPEEALADAARQIRAVTGE